MDKCVCESGVSFAGDKSVHNQGFPMQHWSRHHHWFGAQRHSTFLHWDNNRFKLLQRAPTIEHEQVAFEIKSV